MNPLARFGASTAGLARKLYGTVTGPARHARPDLGTLVRSQFGPGEQALNGLGGSGSWLNYAPWLGDRNPRVISMLTRKLMRHDSQVSLGLAALKSPFFGIEYYLEGGRPIVKAFLRKTLLESHFWYSLLWSVLNSMDYGFQTHEYCWMVANVLVHLDQDEADDENGTQSVELAERYVIRKMRDLDPDRVHLYRDSFGDLCNVFVTSASAIDGVGSAGMGTDLTPEQVLHAVHQGEHDNLRGESVLDRVHMHWHDKHTKLLDFLHYLKQKGNPSVIGNAPNEWVRDEQGNNPIHTLDVMKEALRALKNGSVCVLPSQFDEKGNQLWAIKPLEYQERAEQFLSGLRYDDAQILRGLWVPERIATQDSSVGSNAMAQVHFDTFLLALEVKKEATVLAPINEVAAALVHYNFGKSEIVPRVRGTELASSGNEILKETFIKILALPDRDKDGSSYPARDLTDVTQLMRLLRIPKRAMGPRKRPPAAGASPPPANPSPNPMRGTP